MNPNSSPCAIDAFLNTLTGTDQPTLRRYAEMLDLRFAFLNSQTSGSGGLEATLLSPRLLVPARQLPGGRWDVRVLPLALVLSLALREGPDALEVQLELYQSSPVILRWSGATLATVADDKAFQLLMNTCGFATSSPERPGRLGFRGLG